jgi:predicted ABC-type ATPase
MRPSVYIIAGPNGAGKTTFAREFLPNYTDCRNFVNADPIAQGMSPFSPESAAIRAGRLMLAEIPLLAKRGADFGFETTLYYRTLADRWILFDNATASLSIVATQEQGQLRIIEAERYNELVSRYARP